MKIAVIGYSGAGKSTLAARLGSHYGLPVLHLDQAQFLPGWVERDRGEAQQMVAAFLEEFPSWVIDGNYQRFLQEERLRQADHIIFLSLHRFSCLCRVLRRWHTHRNKTRPDMAEGCAERLDPEFIRWVLWDGRSAAQKRRYQTIAQEYPDKMILLKSQKQIDSFLEGLGKNSAKGISQ